MEIAKSDQTVGAKITENSTETKQDAEGKDAGPASEARESLKVQESDSTMTAPNKCSSKRKSSKCGDYDIYGQFIPYTSEELLKCTICGRQIMAARYSKHLSRCMGYGRTITTRRS